jgi:hypothetical protein
MLKPRWSGEINLGHLIQAATLVVVVGGGAITSYIALRGDLAAQSSLHQVQVGELTARVLVLESRRVEDKEFQRETRGKLDELLKSLADMRYQLALKADRGK